MGWRDLCAGGVAGALLSLSRPPAGITVEEWIAPGAERQALWRAGALVAIALPLLLQPARREGERFPAVELCLGAAAGFALHGLVLIDILAVDSTLSWLFAVLLGLGAMLALARRRASDGPLPGEPPPLLHGLAPALAGGGLSLVLGALSSRLRLF